MDDIMASSIKKAQVFAVLFVQAVQDHILDPDNPALPEREMIATQRYFSSLPDTMLSLFMSIAGGASWEDVQAPLKAISTVWVFFFLFFVSFTYFAVSRQAFFLCRKYGYLKD